MDKAVHERLRRPPFLRSQSDSSSTATIITTSFSHLKALGDIRSHSTAIVGPRRPPRNPARSAIPAASSNSGFVKTSTGVEEEVTPWELYPPPPDKLESVVPLTPSTSKRKSRPSSSGGSSGIHLPDLALLSRRKSLGNKSKPSTSALNSPSLLYKQRPGSGLPNTSSAHLTANSGNATPRLATKIAAVVAPPSHPRLASVVAAAPSHTTVPPSLPPSRTSRQSPATPHQPSPSSPHTHEGSLMPFPTSPSTSSAVLPTSPIQKVHSNPGSKSSSKSSFENNTSNNIKFSTADRTILEELKRNISAREAQFVTKGPNISMGESYDSKIGGAMGFSMGMGSSGSGRKHHPYPKEEAPYPRSYDREVLDLDVWETLFNQRICKSLTWHVFEEPPTKVLDIGCGTGSWILDCARAWRKCHFVGLDIVPVQPDLQQVGSADLAHRVTWVQGNFLEGLPFPNEEFDFVHIKRISLGVPEDKWDDLFEEITRVMKPGAAFEMIEEDLLFPGKVVRNDDEDETAFEDSLDYDVDPAYFSDSDIRQYGGSSYFASGSGTRRGNRHRAHSSVGSTSTAVDFAGSAEDKSTRRESVSGRRSMDSHTQRNSKQIDYAVLTALMGLSDENESERDDDSQDRPRASSDRDSLLASTAGDSSEEFFLVHASPTMPNANMSISSSSSATSLLSSPIMISKHTAVGRGIETEAIVEDEEGEKKAILDVPLTDDANADAPLHTQSPTDSTITPAAFSSSKPRRKSYLASKIHSASTSSLADLRLSSSFNSHSTASVNSSAVLVSPKPRRPSSAGSLASAKSSVNFPGASFSQSMLSLSGNSTPLPGDESRPRSSGGKPGAAPFVLRSLPKPPVNPRDHSILEMIYNEMSAARFVNISPLSLLPNILGLHFKDLRTHPPVLFTFPPIPVFEHPQDQPSLIPRFNDYDPDEEAQDAIRPTPTLSSTSTINANATADPARGRKYSNADSGLSSPITGSPPPTSRTAYFEEGANNEHDHWITMQQIIKRESPYIVYDGSRVSAFSPSTRASFLTAAKAQAPDPAIAPSSSKPLSPVLPEFELKMEDRKIERFSDTDAGGGTDTPRGAHGASDAKTVKSPHASQLRFRLPNTTMNIDLRSLNLHLALRVTEILACSETMWEWVVEYQERIRKQKRAQDTKTAGRARSRSIDPTHMQPRSKQRAPERESSTDRLKSTIAELTREDFDDLMRRFYMDMQDCMAFPSALEERFGWATLPLPPSTERKAFEMECEKFMQWEAQRQRFNIKSTSAGRVPRPRPLSASFPSPISVLNSSLNGVDGLATSSSAHHSEMKLPLNDNKRNSNSHQDYSISSNLNVNSGSVASNMPPPSRRLSRSLRIFVAWKGTEEASS